MTRKDDVLAAEEVIEPEMLQGRDMLFTASVGYADFIRKLLEHYHIQFRETGAELTV